MTAIELFNHWYNEEYKVTKVKIPTACCFSTIGTDNYPNARFVSLKGIVENSFIVTGTITSRKGIEINLINKVALTFWWTETERQVRIQGNATTLNTDLADKYFAERNKESQIVSIVSNQGEKLNDVEELNEEYRKIETTFANQPLIRPENWGGYSIEPIRIEFLEFKSTRFHSRKLYEFKNQEWTIIELQP